VEPSCREGTSDPTYIACTVQGASNSPRDVFEPEGS
jgi:hypothetical protein